MVWENGCTVIVMLTPLVEDGIKQCDRYWPDEGSSLYHVYEVRRTLQQGDSGSGEGGRWSSCSCVYVNIHVHNAYMHTLWVFTYPCMRVFLYIPTQSQSISKDLNDKSTETKS